MTIFEHAKKYEDYIISLRRYFHENPELSGEEDNTIGKIAEELDSMGIEYVDIKPGGILAKISGCSESEKTVLLRADVDALLVGETEENLRQKKTCVSKKSGVMHACGHDGHTAMLLGAAKILTENRKEINGTVYLCFERGEEKGMFEFGGSTVVLLLKKDAAVIDSDILENSAQGAETRVRIGEVIGRKA